MKIQFITFDNSEKLITNQNITYSRFSNPQSFSEFDLNIISLQNHKIWYNLPSKFSVSCENDLNSLNQQMTITNKTAIVFLPQNYQYMNNYFSAIKRYSYSTPLKNVINVLFDNVINDVLLQGLINNEYQLLFENCKTKIGNSEINAAFAINCEEEGLTISKSGNSKTTVKCSENCILSSLDLRELNIDDFLNEIDLFDESITYPDWLKEYEFYDDKALTDKLNQDMANLNSINESIEQTKNAQDFNLRCKSILIDTGDSLVKKCFYMLQKMFECDLSEFEDQKKADFIIKKEYVTFVGEIKGISSNVKRATISQVERHLSDYLDELDENNTQETVKGVLLISHQRDKKLNEREDIHTNVIDMATKNNILIVTTDVFLKIYEKLLNKEFDSKSIIDIFYREKGLLKIEDCIVEREEPT